jgi:multidrug efflux system membrane fusion protein
MRLQVDRDALVIPANAVVPGQDGNYVFVLGKDSTVAIRKVDVARSAGRDAIIREGVTVGEVVVTDGQIRLRDGTRVAVSGVPGRATLGADAPAQSAP